MEEFDNLAELKRQCHRPVMRHLYFVPLRIIKMNSRRPTCVPGLRVRPHSVQLAKPKVPRRIARMSQRESPPKVQRLPLPQLILRHIDLHLIRMRVPATPPLLRKFLRCQPIPAQNAGARHRRRLD